MTIITPTLPTPDVRPFVRLGHYDPSPTPSLDLGPCMAIGCNMHVHVADVFDTDRLLAIVEPVDSEDVSIRDYPFHHGCAARLLADMFDHFCGSTNGCPFCGAEWQTYSERDGSVFIEHHDHCLYDALMDALSALDDEDLLR